MLLSVHSRTEHEHIEPDGGICESSAHCYRLKVARATRPAASSDNPVIGVFDHKGRGIYEIISFGIDFFSIGYRLFLLP
jgi:hypothetical protein